MGRHSVPEVTAAEVAGIADTDGMDVMRHADELEALSTSAHGHFWELVGGAGDNSLIYNVTDPAGQYLYTLTIGRTPGC